MANWSRWKPRRVFCTLQRDHSDQPGLEYVVKLGQHASGTAALISELICTTLLSAGGVATLQPAFVVAGPAFAASYAPSQQVAPGTYFGTQLLRDVDNGPPISMKYVEKPQQIVDIWAFDSWLCNIDRNATGNILLSLTRNGKFQQVAADQSDCFGGTTRIVDGSWKRVLTEYGSAESVEFLDQALYDVRGNGVRAAIAKVRAAAIQLEAVIDSVPQAWWRQVNGMKPDELRMSLAGRARRLEAILNLAMWDGIDDATRGGLLL